MQFDFVVSASVERTEGKFASRDELEEQLVEALEGADPGSLEGDGGGQYEVSDWSVEAQATPAQRKAAVKQAAQDPGPGIGRIIYSWVRLNNNPSDANVATFEEDMQALLARFPNVVKQAERLTAAYEKADAESTPTT